MLARAKISMAPSKQPANPLGSLNPQESRITKRTIATNGSIDAQQRKLRRQLEHHNLLAGLASGIEPSFSAIKTAPVITKPKLDPKDVEIEQLRSGLTLLTKRGKKTEEQLVELHKQNSFACDRERALHKKIHLLQQKLDATQKINGVKEKPEDVSVLVSRKELQILKLQNNLEHARESEEFYRDRLMEVQEQFDGVKQRIENSPYKREILKL